MAEQLGSGLQTRSTQVQILLPAPNFQFEYYTHFYFTDSARDVCKIHLNYIVNPSGLQFMIKCPSAVGIRCDKIIMYWFAVKA